VDKVSTGYVKTVQTPAQRADPEVAGPVLVDGSDLVAAQAFRIVRIMLKADKFVIFPVQPTQSTFMGSYPESAGTILVNDPDEIINQAERIDWIIFVMSKLFFFTAKFIKSSAHGADPQYTRLILMDGKNESLTQAAGIAGIVMEVFKHSVLWIKPAQASIRSDPKQVRPVFPKGPDNIVRHTVGIERIMFITGELSGLSVILVESAPIRSNPEHSRMVFKK